MVESYTIEPADDSVPIDPRALRELRDLLRKDEDLDLGVRLEDRPPEPGEQGAVPVALEIIAAATPLGTAFASVLKHWIDKHKLSVNIRRKGDNYTFQLSGGNVRDVERLITNLEKGNNAGYAHGG
jgi:Effector Associated Constant Component 1